MDTPTSVDRNAPVLAHHEIDINAPLARSGRYIRTSKLGQPGSPISLPPS